MVFINSQWAERKNNVEENSRLFSNPVFKKKKIQKVLKHLLSCIFHASIYKTGQTWTRVTAKYRKK